MDMRKADVDGYPTAVDTTDSNGIAHEQERAITDGRGAFPAETETCGYAAAGANTP